VIETDDQTARSLGFMPRVHRLMKNDPFELRSRHNAPAYAPVRGELAAELQKLRKCAGASCRIHP
jgi:hypothetical protein